MVVVSRSEHFCWYVSASTIPVCKLLPVPCVSRSLGKVSTSSRTQPHKGKRKTHHQYDRDLPFTQRLFERTSPCCWRAETMEQHVRQLVDNPIFLRFHGCIINSVTFVFQLLQIRNDCSCSKCTSRQLLVCDWLYFSPLKFYRSAKTDVLARIFGEQWFKSIKDCILLQL